MEPGGGVDPIVRSELTCPAPEAARAFVAPLRERYGDAVVAILFYGSCLRGATAEGVLDFYVVVDRYRETYRSRWLAAANALLPPNVFYLEHEAPSGTLRAKVAIMSSRDFERGTGPRTLRPGFWARFAQPVIAVYLRDAAALERMLAAARRAIRTAVIRGLGLVPADGVAARFDAEQLWLAVFRETYASELRAERDERVRSLYEAAPQRYARVLGATLEELAVEGRLELAIAGGIFQVSRAPGLLARRRRLRRWGAKAAGLAQLLKSALTFGDWVPYALWKLERHTGTRLELSERQRRHPFLFAWPVFFRVLARRELR